MPIETEAKLPLADPEGLRRRLAALDAPLAAAFTEDNRFFDLPGDRLRGADRALRLRTETPRAGSPHAGPPRHVLCHKGPRLPGAGGAADGLKRRPEHEIVVADADGAAAFLAALGYAPRFRFEKRRDRHRLGGCVVEIDELPGLGFFVEVEGPDPDAVEATLARLGLRDAPREPRGYLALLIEGGRCGPGDPPTFRFG
ncbi:class IV adenylate cyclase [Phycisphaera mikurensis]|uniref:Adenylate cyclase n=1 Tax=Phycisphaera mikurensis (strain NBRC 102666 / KCTC 22515 / FYK2301M01) TaxID=1142394 RepID=I0IBP7_PHYMF|nr:class IV adenylate cyclase [Phycisphaera mikurensis]MBB6443381.1 adenylate cyclase class 2 [Phycisphaera mikurensis]BAM02685.1 adenylate cyclase [Phycisphaera mikurensis NBRC 102666]